MSRARWWMAASVVPCLLLVLPASSLYYKWTGGEGCARCHEIRANWNSWHESTHRGVSCGACHGDSFSGGADFDMANLRRLVKHVTGDVPEQIRIKGLDTFPMLTRCQGCHRQEFADWAAGPHGARFAKFFVDAKHNRQRLLMDDCLRCHGTQYEGGIHDLVTPIDTKGPWAFTDRSWTNLPAIPCLACHQMHRRGEPARPGQARDAATRPSLALFDRREMAHVANAELAIPAMLEGTRPIRMSPDRRQALCYQCHAPLATHQVNSGDDRTAIGVHEGIGCLGCHEKHGQQARASCANCHPRWSNCGLDVEKMDTTFLSSKSTHNIHFVKCLDCHTKGVPKKHAIT